MGGFTGMGGSISIGGTVYGVEQWSMTYKNELQDVTTTASNGFVERIPAVSDAELTCSFFPTGADIDALVTAILPGTSMTVVLNVGPVISTKQATWSGTFLAGSLGTENNPKTPVKLNLTASSTGAVTFAQA